MEISTAILRAAMQASSTFWRATAIQGGEDPGSREMLIKGRVRPAAGFGSSGLQQGSRASSGFKLQGSPYRANSSTPPGNFNHGLVPAVTADVDPFAASGWSTAGVEAEINCGNTPGCCCTAEGSWCCCRLSTVPSAVLMEKWRSGSPSPWPPPSEIRAAPHAPAPQLPPVRLLRPSADHHQLHDSERTPPPAPNGIVPLPESPRPLFFGSQIFRTCPRDPSTSEGYRGYRLRRSVCSPFLRPNLIAALLQLCSALPVSAAVALTLKLPAAVSLRYWTVPFQVRRLDAYLDRLPVLSEESSEDGRSDTDDHTFAAATAFSSPRLDQLLHVVQSLSTTSSSQPLLPAWRIKHLLTQSGILATAGPALRSSHVEVRSPYENEIEWLLVSKATIQLHGVVLNTLLDQIIPLSDDIWYWDEVLSSYSYSSLYTVQTSPLRFWAWSQEVYQASKTRIRSSSIRNAPGDFVDSTRTGLSQQWRQFYGIVRDTIRERSFANLQRNVLSPVALCRSEARRKQAQLKKLREITASGLGVLMDEGLQFGPEDEKAEMQDHHDLKGVVERSVALMDMVLKEVCTLDVNINDFEDKVFAGVEEDPELSVHLEDSTATDRPAVLARRLLNIIDQTLPGHLTVMQNLAKDHGRPTPLVRYWIPAVVGILSSTTVLRILVHRKAEIVNWFLDFGATVRDFWFNWVVEPLGKVISTIRHDKTSEIAIMSRDSLKADRESLERMVVEFALDKPHFAIEGASLLSDAQVAEIRSKVAEGDVTPVLRAFEQDLQRPFMGAIRGDLVRSLLIQVQKTKVDLEVAMTGIDSLLKSQELVFGFVGLTPGVLVSIGFVQYIRGIFGSRTGQRNSKKSGKAVRILRNIDRILSEARPTENNLLSYKDHGLLLCEVHVLRNLVDRLMPREVGKEFLEDLDDLSNMKGIQVQAKALERIRWAYARWLK
ncbi:hypothetical protein G7046_g5755 [Stylonectria norvegica]|nr:hypothetical protein G7046_g5755 [Stylonectria norvegica]